MTVNVDAQKAFIFRVVHRANFTGVLQDGLLCRNAAADPSNYRNIGNLDLIAKRHHKPVPIAPGGTLSDYVPFYFTYASPMLYNIKTGRNVPHCPNSEMIFLVTTLHRLREIGVQFAFTDRHAFSVAAEFSNDLNLLDRIDWDILQRRDFRHDIDNPGKVDRYMAEALAYQRVPLDGLLGVACYDSTVDAELKQMIAARGLELPTAVKPGWYF